MDFNESVKEMGNKMTHFRIDEKRVGKLRGTFTPTGGAYWDETHTQDGMPMHKCLVELCKRVLIHNNYRVDLHPLNTCDKGGSSRRIVDQIGIKHPDANYYTATVKFVETYSEGLSNYGYFIVSSPRIYRHKSIYEVDWNFQNCSMKSNDMNRTFAGVSKLLPIKDRELLLGITVDRDYSVTRLLDADKRELQEVSRESFRQVEPQQMRHELMRLLAASKEGVVAPYVNESDINEARDAYEEYLKRKAELEESVEHNAGQVPVHIIRTFTGDALYCRYHSDIDEATEDVYAPILPPTSAIIKQITSFPHGGDWQVYQKIEDLPVALYSKIMVLNVASQDRERLARYQELTMRGVGMMFPADTVVKEHYVIFVHEKEDVFSAPPHTEVCGT